MPHNDKYIVMRLYKYLNNIQNKLIIPFFFSSFLLVIEAVCGVLLTRLDNPAAAAFDVVIKAINIILPFVFVYFISLYSCIGKRYLKTVITLFCYAVFYVVLYLNTGAYAGVIFALGIAFVAVSLYRSTGLCFASFLLLIFSVLTALLAASVYDYYDGFINFLASLTANKGYVSALIFSVIKQMLSLLGINSYNDAFMHTAYGGAQIINGEIVTGAADLFSAGYRGELLAKFVSGGYLFSACVFGVGISFLSSLKGDKKRTALILTAATIISGKNTLFFIFVILLCPRLFASLLLLSALSYSAAYLLDIRCGYVFSRGFAEVFSFINKPAYFFCVIVVLLVLGYFTSKFCAEKYGFTSFCDTYIPTGLEELCESLGGAANIVKITENTVEVRNVKAVNELKLQFSAEGNLLTLENCKNLNELKEYLE